MSFKNLYWSDIFIALAQALAMVSGALVLTVILVLPLGILLFVTGRRQPFEQPVTYAGEKVQMAQFLTEIMRLTGSAPRRNQQHTSARPFLLLYSINALERSKIAFQVQGVSRTVAISLGNAKPPVGPQRRVRAGVGWGSRGDSRGTGDTSLLGHG